LNWSGGFSLESRRWDGAELTTLLAALGCRLALVEAPGLSAAEVRRRFAHLHEEAE
jgi:hypothetical protein